MNPNKSKKDAITTVNTALTAQYVNTFVHELTVPQQTAVREGVEAIVKAQLSIVQSRIVIGENLSKMHTALGQETFDKFCSAVGTKIGLSRSTAYRYLGGFKLIVANFGPVASNVLALTDGGQSIVKTDLKSGAIALTPEAKAIVAKMPTLPANASSDDREKWAREFSVQVTKAGRGGAGKKTATDLISERITRLWDVYGDVCERINKLAGAKERHAALDEVRDTLQEMSKEYEKMAKTVNAVSAKPPEPKTKTNKTAQPNVAAA